MKPEKEDLIHDVLDSDSSREATLMAGNRVLRRRRFWRAARVPAVGFAIVAIVTALILPKDVRHQTASNSVRPLPEAPTVSKVEALTDDQLLAMFPETPVGLVSLADGKKRLVFPRPGDEAKFITRL